MIKENDVIMEIKHRTHINQLLWHLGLDGDTVEVGCAEGFFTEEMLRWALSGTHYMVDNWGMIDGVTGDGNFPNEWHEKNYNDAMSRIEPYAHRVVVLRGMSTEMAKQIPDNSVVCVYVDAGHSYESVKADIEAFYPKLVAGGVMAFHDYEATEYGVKQAVNEFAKQHNLTVHFIAENKLEDAGAWFVKAE